VTKQEQINTLHKALICLTGVETSEINDIIRANRYIADVIEELMKEKNNES
jgi:RNA processing factor Prp31